MREAWRGKQKSNKHKWPKKQPKNVTRGINQCWIGEEKHTPSLHQRLWREPHLTSCNQECSPLPQIAAHFLFRLCYIKAWRSIAVWLCPYSSVLIHLDGHFVSLYLESLSVCHCFLSFCQEHAAIYFIFFWKWRISQFGILHQQLRQKLQNTSRLQRLRQPWVTLSWISMRGREKHQPQQRSDSCYSGIVQGKVMQSAVSLCQNLTVWSKIQKIS